MLLRWVEKWEITLGIMKCPLVYKISLCIESSEMINVKEDQVIFHSNQHKHKKCLVS